MKKLISIVLPIYNVENYIEKCMESVLNQTYKNIEIILVDDGSPDNCPIICDQYVKEDNRVKVVHKENGGLSDARNAGIKVANGDYITFIDSDDYVDKDYVEFLYNTIEETDADIAIGGHRVIYDSGKIIEMELIYPHGENYIKDIYLMILSFQKEDYLKTLLQHIC